MALEGTIKTPIGTVQKKTALLIGGGVLILGVIVYYRQQQLGDSETTIPDAPINPATGYPYGSAEDAAALADQASYISPPAGGGGGSSSIPQSNVGYTSNGQWTQAVIATLSNSGAISDPTQLSAALGKYITGAYVAPGSNEDVLIQQAISVEGYPPVNGASGYPPSINRTPPVSPANTKPGPITGLRLVTANTNQAYLDWNDSPNSRGYDVRWADAKTGKTLNNTALSSWFTAVNLASKHTYTFQVRARPDTGSNVYGDWATISVRTK